MIPFLISFDGEFLLLMREESLLLFSFVLLQLTTVDDDEDVELVERALLKCPSTS